MCFRIMILKQYKSVFDLREATKSETDKYLDNNSYTFFGEDKFGCEVQ